tara:strand:+ start:1307 stop:1669 length:363 start_codon:yes stop_codon:yes gene_type:complete
MKITTESGLIGKTIKDLKQDFNGLYIAFTDGTYTVLEIKEECRGFNSSLPKIKICDHPHADYDSALLDMGVISEETYTKANNEYRAKEKLREERRDAERNQYAREQDEKTYEELKKRLNK